MDLLPPEALREQTASRFPSYRPVDIKSTVPVSLHGHDRLQAIGTSTSLTLAASTSSGSSSISRSPNSSANVKDHYRTLSASTISTPKKPDPPKARPQTSPYPSALEPIHLPPNSVPFPLTPRTTKARNVPGRNSRNGLEDFGKGPPRAMITQRSYKVENSSNTTDWVRQQSIAGDDEPQLPAQAQPSRPVTESAPGRPLIKPIRGFKPSTRKSVEMTSRRISMDPDSTLRALDGFDKSQYSPNQPDEQNSDDSDLFLRAAREEELARQTSNTDGDTLSRSDSRKSRIGQRASLPPSSNLYQPSISRRRGSDQESNSGIRPVDEQEGIPQALTYRPTGRDRPSALDDISRSRYLGANSRSTPTTPRGFGSREISPESQSQYAQYGGRRPSVPDALPARNPSYRQSNLSYSTPRTYNSSPLVSRTMDMQETPETPRVAEGTESTVSTTAPSTVWDELEDLKSRIHRLELTGKLPPTSGAAMSRASNDRPPTATTTVTTMSSSPKRGRGNSTSPTEAVAVDKPAEAHPLLHAALAKSKTLLGAEVYKALEATASDALAISSMMGSFCQHGPISSSQSTIGGTNSVSDRQVRRKADSLCRSLTELCLALSEGKTDRGPNEAALLPTSRDNEFRATAEAANNQRQQVTTDVTRVKSSPRALSRLEARRSSLLATSTLPSPRYTPSEASTPTQSSMAGRRTSLLLRSRRGGTEEPEDEDDSRFRAPSRAITEVGRVRNSPREYTSQQPLPEKQTAIQSSLPVRRHYASTSLTHPGVTSMPPVSSSGGRKYLDRSTPERDANSDASRLAEERGQRKSSISQAFPFERTGSLTRRTKQPTSSDSSAGQQNGTNHLT